MEEFLAAFERRIDKKIRVCIHYEPLKFVFPHYGTIPINDFVQNMNDALYVIFPKIHLSRDVCLFILTLNFSAESRILIPLPCCALILPL